MMIQIHKTLVWILGNNNLSNYYFKKKISIIIIVNLLNHLLTAVEIITKRDVQDYVK